MHPQRSSRALANVWLSKRLSLGLRVSGSAGFRGGLGLRVRGLPVVSIAVLFGVTFKDP